MTKDDIRKSGMLEQYVLGLLSEQDVRKVEGYLMQYPELQQDYLEIQLAMQAYAKSEAVSPKRDLESNIIALIKLEGSKTKIETNSETTSKLNNEQSNQGSLGAFKRFVLFSLGAITLLSAWYAFEKHRDNKKLQESYIALKDDCDSEQVRQNEIINQYEQVNNPASRTLNITPTDGYKETNLLFHFNPVDKQNYIQVKNLPTIASNQAFQLWSLKDGVDPIPLTVFKQGDNFILPVDFEEGTGTYAITIEDEGGATVPTLTRLIGTVGVS